MDTAKRVLINRYCSSLNRFLMFRPIGLTLRAAPALATRGHPRLTKAGNNPTNSQLLYWFRLCRLPRVLLVVSLTSPEELQVSQMQQPVSREPHRRGG